MKWIDAQTVSGQSIALSVNSDGIFFPELMVLKPHLASRVNFKRAWVRSVDMLK